MAAPSPTASIAARGSPVRMILSRPSPAIARFSQSGMMPWRISIQASAALKTHSKANVTKTIIRVAYSDPLAVVLIRSHRPEPLVVACGEGAVGLGGIAVDERPQEHRVRGATHFMFDREEVLSVCEIDDVAKAVLIGIVFAEDEI